MFTGIIHELGAVSAVRPWGRGRSVVIRAPKSVRRLAVGSSVSVNGVCLTVTKRGRGAFAFDLMATTLGVTDLGELKRGSHANVETSLRRGDELGGHFLMGHVDAIGRVQRVARQGMHAVMSVSLPNFLRRYVVRKGPIAVEGVSLTVKEVRSDSFDLALIPFTLKHTTLGRKRVGDTVNIEVDLIAKYLEQFHRLPTST